MLYRSIYIDNPAYCCLRSQSYEFESNSQHKLGIDIRD